MKRNFGTESSTLQIAASVVEPSVLTKDSNNLGIEEVLGVGYSNFSGSPSNRIKNIRFASAGKLDGLLIKPGEVFSLLAALEPFTIEGGYLPELVIKGDEIIPEVGGGLCQIGSTMFRAAMNSAMPIVDRRNHSLVVSYYNDPRNGLPGTDATIYEGAPDLKFRNDTENYMMITTDMDVTTGDLRFTLWGKNDGRSGSYTAPVVSSWIPAGETVYKKTTDLEVGEEKCQGAHPGAVASFVYNRTLPSGEIVARTFESKYRALPEICLVGATEEEIAEEKAAQEAEQRDAEANEEVTPDTEEFRFPNP